MHVPIVLDLISWKHDTIFTVHVCKYLRLRLLQQFAQKSFLTQNETKIKISDSAVGLWNSQAKSKKPQSGLGVQINLYLGHVASHTQNHDRSETHNPCTGLWNESCVEIVSNGLQHCSRYLTDLVLRSISFILSASHSSIRSGDLIELLRSTPPVHMNGKDILNMDKVQIGELAISLANGIDVAACQISFDKWVSSDVGLDLLKFKQFRSNRKQVCNICGGPLLSSCMLRSNFSKYVNDIQSNFISTSIANNQ